MNKKEVGLTNYQIAEIINSLCDDDFLEVFDELRGMNVIVGTIGCWVDECLREIKKNIAERKIEEIISRDIEPGTYNIHFNENDETQFYAEDGLDLRDLWREFCNENDFEIDCINSIEKVEDDIDIETARLVVANLNYFHELTSMECKAIEMVLKE